MWLLNWLPDWIFYLILLLGIGLILVSWVLKFIPVIKTYSLPLQVGGICLTVLGVWYSGGIAKDQEYKEKIAALEKQILEKQAESQKINSQVVTKYLTKTQIIKEKGDTVVEYIDRVITKTDEQCQIPKEAIILHNAAATNSTESLEQALTPGTLVDTSQHNKLAKP